MNVILDHTVVLLIVAIIVALIARVFRLPYTVGLVIAGIGLAFIRPNSEIHLTHNLIFTLFLPPLLFEAALNIHWQKLCRDLLPVLTLTIFGVIISALFVAWGMFHFLGWVWSSAVIFGILIAATDPVAVIAMFKDNNAPKRLRLLVESESLFNDGVAAVFFAVALAWAQGTGGDTLTMAAMVQSLAVTVGGGILIGGICGWLTLKIASHATDHLVEAALTTVTAYGAFLLAEHFYVSGVLATVTAGLTTGN